MKLNLEYSHASDAKEALDKLEELKANVELPFIVDSTTLDNDFFNLTYIDGLYEVKRRIYDYMSELAGHRNFWEILKSNVFEKDKEWTAWRNANLTGEYYRKYKIKSDYLPHLSEIIDGWISETRDIYEQMKQRENEAERLKEERRVSFSIVVTNDIEYPSKDQDGFFNGIIKNNKTGYTAHFIAKNVFDFGYFSFPIRLAGTEDVFNNKSWTEEERQIAKWLYEFPPFSKTTFM